MVRAVQYFFIFVFMITILTPIAVKNKLFSVPEVEVNENRKLAKRPEGSWINHISTLDDYTGEMDAFYQDTFAGRSLAIRMKNTLYYHLFRSTKDITVGPSNWLFYPDAQTHLTGTVKYWRKKKKLIFSLLKKFQDALADKGIYFIFYIAPHKQSIYPEYFPLKQPSDTWRDELKSGAEEYGLNYLDAYSILRNAKTEFPYPIYYKTDWHWTSVGAATVGKAIINKLSQDIDPGVKWLNSIEGTSSTYSGPQAWALATFTEVKEEAWEEVSRLKKCINTTDSKNFVDSGSCQHKKFPPILMIGDSFNEGLAKTDFSAYFESVKSIHRNEKSKRISEIPGDAKIILFEAIEMNFVILFNNDAFWSRVSHKMNLSKK